MTEQRCGAWLKKPCCPCDWFTHTHDLGDMAAKEGELAVCTIMCSGDTAHIYRAGERCGRLEVPPLVPSWSRPRLMPAQTPNQWPWVLLGSRRGEPTRADSRLCLAPPAP